MGVPEWSSSHPILSLASVGGRANILTTGWFLVQTFLLTPYHVMMGLKS